MTAEAPARAVLHLSDLALRLRGDRPDVLEALVAIWAPAYLPHAAMLGVRQRRALGVWRDGRGARIEVDGAPFRELPDARDALAVADEAIYHCVHESQQARTLLHAAGCADGARILLLVGPSGSGKTSLCRAWLERRGGDYLSDELCVFDGTHLWGVPRALQYDALPASAPTPAWLRGVDRGRYLLRGRDGRPWHVPFVERLPGAVLRAPVPVVRASVHVVEIGRGPHTRLTPRSPVEALAALHAAALRPPQQSMGGLVRAGRCHALTWTEPDAAVEALQRALAKDG